MGKQFESVNSRFGAPMGRYAAPELDPTRGTVRLFKVRLDSGGYDDGGAYWGHGGDGPVYCAVDRDGNMQFTRASNRRHAAFLLGIPAPSLIRPFDYQHALTLWSRAGVLDRDDLAAYWHACRAVESDK